jgi:ParB family chromosome partitioning protein
VARLGGLGKGLGALIPPADNEQVRIGANPDAARLEDLPLDAIRPNPHQPRVHFDEESLSDLAASIREIGVLQPVLVRPRDGAYELLAGERRWRAARRAGLTVIPAVVKDTDELGSVERALVENLHRQDLTPLEEAAAYQQLVEDFGFTHEEVAGRVGKSRAAVTNTLRLMSLPPSIQHLLADGRLAAGHARALLGTPDRAFQEQLARRAASEGWSVRAVEEAVRQRAGGGVARVDTGVVADASADASGTSNAGRTATPSAQGLPALLELEELLAERLSTQVSVTMRARRGKIVIDFADLEDLERLYHLMNGTASPNHLTDSD